MNKEGKSPMSDTQKELWENCKYVGEHIERFLDDSLTYDASEDTFHPKEEGLADDGLYGYIQNNVYDIKLTVDLEGTLYGCELQVAGGGPNIYIDTNTGNVEGYWWGDRASYSIDKRICTKIENEIEQMRGF